MKRLILTLCILGLTCAPAYAQSGAAPKDNGSEAVSEAPSESGNDEAGEGEKASEETPKSIYDDSSLKPRDVYNLALTKLDAGEFDVAIEGFSRARDDAAYDNELRYSAAYDLAHAYAQKAFEAGDIQSIDEAALEGVIDDLQMSAAWFRDAVRQRPSLEDARGNLEIVLKRLLMAKDVMAQRFNTIDRQLDAVIASERQIRESVRVLSEQIEKNNAGRDPIAFQEDFKAMARTQREALTEANLVAENVANLQSAIESKTEEERTQEEAFQLFQYQSVSPLLENARQAMAGARRKMREFSMDDSLRLTNKAFYKLKQAREMLDDPLRMLGSLMQDEQGFVGLTSKRLMFDTPELLKEFREKIQNPEAEAPPWLNMDLLKDTQLDVLVRVNRLTALLKAVTEAARQQEAQSDTSAQPQQDPRQAEAAREQMAQVGEAIPFIEAAADAMQRATQTLETPDLRESLKNGVDASEQLALAMERFANLKYLIEIAYQTQSGISLLAGGVVPNGDEEKTQYLPRTRQREALGPVLNNNRDRLKRMADMLVRESGKANEQVDQAVRQAGAQGDEAQKQIEEQTQQIRQLFDQAETLRKQALDATERMIATISVPPADGVDENLVPESPAEAEWTNIIGDAETAKQSIEQLRILFFSVVEHIQELLRQQMQTLDSTTDISTMNADEQAMKLPPVVDRQRMHEVISDQLAEVLNKQSEQLQQAASRQGGQPGQGGADPAEMAQHYNQAASELQVASTAMRQAQTDLQAEPTLYTEALEQQKNAAEHIKKALELLQPPQQKQQQQQQQQQQQKKQKMSKEQAEKKIQQIRSRDQQRRKSKERKKGEGMPVVEKDW